MVKNELVIKTSKMLWVREKFPTKNTLIANKPTNKFTVSKGERRGRDKLEVLDE